LHGQNAASGGKAPAEPEAFSPRQMLWNFCMVKWPKKPALPVSATPEYVKISGFVWECVDINSKGR